MKEREILAFIASRYFLDDTRVNGRVRRVVQIVHVYSYFGNTQAVRDALGSLMNKDQIRKDGPGLYGVNVAMGSDTYEPTQKGMMRLWLQQD